MSFQVSNASEIQFWPTGEESFNIKQEAYTEDACFHQKFLCTGLRKLQVLGGADDDQELRLSILEDGEEVETINFTQTDDGIPSSGGVTSAMSISALSTWLTRSISPSLADWILSATPGVNVMGSGPFTPGESEILHSGFAFILGYTYSITITYTKLYNSGTSNPRTLYLRAYDNSFNVIQTVSETTPASPGGTDSVTLTFVSLGTETKIGVEVSDGSDIDIIINTVSGTQTTAVVPAVPANYYLNSVSFSPYDYSLCNKFLTFKIIQKAVDLEDEIELFYSDSVEFVYEWVNSNHDGRVVIQFRSINNFAGLIYDEDSPYFSIDLDGQFVEPDFATTEKVSELTEMVINTASTLKEKSNLILNDLPRYMHRKVLLILQHSISGSVLVNDIEISLDGGSYELTKRDQKYNLKPAQIMLTHKNSYTHNVI